MPLSAGSLRQKVGFYARIEITDAYGNVVTGFAEQPELTCAASIAPKLGGESILAGRLQGTSLVNITVRRSRDTDRIELDWCAKNERSGEIYNVRSKIDPLQDSPQRGRIWEMLCEKGVAL